MKIKILNMSILLMLSLFIIFNLTFTKASAMQINYSIVVDLNDCKLFLIQNENNEIIKTYTIACGKPTTPSPVGTWKIIDKGRWTKGFGTRWMGLNVPWGKYGIHGTNKPNSIGSATSEGCIRMFNKDVEELYDKVGYGTTVILYGGPYCMMNNKTRTLVPGNTGADVYNVQKILKDRGYYNFNLDGRYGESLKQAVIKFKKDNRLYPSYNIDTNLYKLLNMNPFE